MKGLNFAQTPGAGASLTGAFLERIQQTRQMTGLQPDNIPQYEIPIMLALAQLRPNPDNPRTSRNPKYEEIKQSIRVRGLDTVPKVTKDPEGENDIYIFSDGGNTRYAILCELYEETRDERFNHIQCVFKPWPGRLKCLLGHLAENDLRGDLTFIDRAKGVLEARTLYCKEEMIQFITLRELADRLKQSGYSVSHSEIQRMEYSLEHLYPVFPRLFDNGMGRPQVRSLIRLHRAFTGAVSANAEAFGDLPGLSIFGTIAARYDDPDLWSFEVFEDELLNALSQASNHSPDWWKLLLSGNAEMPAASLRLPPSPADDMTLPPLTSLPPAPTPPVISAGTAPGTEVCTAGLSLEELARAREAENEDSETVAVTPAGDPRLNPAYQEEQLSLTEPATPPPSGVTIDTRSVSQLRNRLLREAFALADMAGVPDCVVSDDGAGIPGFCIMATSDGQDNTGIIAFLRGISEHPTAPSISLPLFWLCGDEQAGPDCEGALPLVTGLLTGVAQLRALLRERGADPVSESEEI